MGGGVKLSHLKQWEGGGGGKTVQLKAVGGVGRVKLSHLKQS